jgi:hypothetical protein
MKKRIRFLIFLLVLSAVSGICFSYSQSASAVQGGSAGGEKPAEQVFKNIQVFKGLPSSQLLGAMNFMAGSLGVACTHCHVANQFAKDDKPTKQTARQMILMMRKINEDNFGGKLNVNCSTCHSGKTRPGLIPPLTAQQASATAAGATATTAEALPTVDQVLDKYVQALGGKEKIEKMTTQVMVGPRIESSGANPPSTTEMQIYRRSPNQLMMIMATPQQTITQAFNGTTGWRKFNDRISPMSAADMVGARRDAIFLKDIELKPQYTKLTIVGKQQVEGHETYVLEGTLTDDSPQKKMFGIETENLYFDTQTGLLIRRSMVYRTPLGPLPEVTDYEDYRKVKGIMMPFTIRLSRPPFVYLQKFNKIELNTSLPEKQFDQPAAK